MLALNSTLGRSFNVDLEDSLNAKRAFEHLGLMKKPKHGVTPYPDEPLFGAIEKFQKKKNLKVDGVMHPEGETAAAVGEALMPSKDTLKGSNGHVQAKSGKCPPGYSEVTEATCVPRTEICIYRQVCIPITADGGTRG